MVCQASGAEAMWLTVLDILSATADISAFVLAFQVFRLPQSKTPPSCVSLHMVLRALQHKILLSSNVDLLCSMAGIWLVKLDIVQL